MRSTCVCLKTKKQKNYLDMVKQKAKVDSF